MGNRLNHLQRMLPWISFALLLVSGLSGHFPVIPIAAAAGNDCNVQWKDVFHDTFDTVYRSIVGPVSKATTGTTKNIRLRIRVDQGDINSAYVRIWNARTGKESWIPMSWDGEFDNSSVFDWWVANLNVGTEPTILYYLFELKDEANSCG